MNLGSPDVPDDGVRTPIMGNSFEPHLIEKQVSFEGYDNGMKPQSSWGVVEARDMQNVSRRHSKMSKAVR